MELYLIRHGQSEANALKVYSGWAEYSLTPLGEQQALRTGELVKNIAFDRIISSDLLRARQTAALVFPGRTIEINSDIREVNLTRIAGQPIAEIKARLRAVSDKSLKEYDYSVLGCESVDHFMARIAHFLDGLDKSSPERIAVVAHNGALRAMAAHVLEAKWSTVSVKNDNCSVSVLESVRDHWTIKHWNYTKAL